MKIAVIFVGATQKQNQYWWPSYQDCDADIEHDLIIVHRNMDGVPMVDIPEIYGDVIFENKILESGEIEHKAFGAYRYFFKKYQDQYDYFAFISDDVQLKRDNWLKDAIDIFQYNDKIGFVSPLVHNNPPHVRAPIWFGKTECLSKIDWDFNSDHEGEMTLADKCVTAGYFGVQVGHKIDFAYDPDWKGFENPSTCGCPQPLRIFEEMNFGKDHQKFTWPEIESMDRFLMNLEKGDNCHHQCMYVSDSRKKVWNITIEIQPFHGLIYNGGLHIAREEGLNIDVWDTPMRSGEFNPLTDTWFGGSSGTYSNCIGINKENPIAILKF